MNCREVRFTSHYFFLTERAFVLSRRRRVGRRRDARCDRHRNATCRYACARFTAPSVPWHRAAWAPRRKLRLFRFLPPPLVGLLRFHAVTHVVPTHAARWGAAVSPSSPRYLLLQIYTHATRPPLSPPTHRAACYTTPLPRSIFPVPPPDRSEQARKSHGERARGGGRG